MTDYAGDCFQFSVCKNEREKEKKSLTEALITIIFAVLTLLQLFELL